VRARGFVTRRGAEPERALAGGAHGVVVDRALSTLPAFEAIPAGPRPSYVPTPIVAEHATSITETRLSNQMASEAVGRYCEEGGGELCRNTESGHRLLGSAYIFAPYKQNRTESRTDGHRRQVDASPLALQPDRYIIHPHTTGRWTQWNRI